MRTFIAIELEPELTEQLVNALNRVRRLAPHVRWVPEDNLHVTLAFLGEIADAQVPAVAESLKQVCARHPPMNLSAHGSGTFGTLDSPRVLWVALNGERQALSALQADLTQVLGHVDYAPEHGAYEPHVTLGRSKTPRGDAALARCAEALRGDAFGDLRVDKLSLFVSDTHLEGVHYTSMGRYALTGTKD